MSWAKSLVHQSPQPLERLKPFPRPCGDGRGWLPGCRKGNIHAIRQRPLPSKPPSDPHLPASPLPPEGRVPCPARLTLTVLICSLGFHVDPDLSPKQGPQPPRWPPSLPTASSPQPPHPDSSPITSLIQIPWWLIFHLDPWPQPSVRTPAPQLPSRGKCHELPPSSGRAPSASPPRPWWLNRVLHTRSRSGHSLKPKEGQ